ncbi:PAS domain S-box protein [Algibacter amylolyticus]|uniref:histidine kinase n=1 Tax=Algibacter amylolyticus TaxID=1608400 RepID=A0A5M7AUP7_9FLAO|nr:sensor histidine kinase [Algibacter amylolyticus]KAA5821193.1 PAS domain S-box protein [Algibacter amylolyticus]MBB5269840.1 PAS domain S-box-containing protein [Algibacter amylolyticus]TSJ72139.1 PAS domain S-box protein [Algibacter amylolyticus]
MKANLNSEIIAVIATNKEGIIYQFNEGAEILLGYTASEMIGLKTVNSFLVEKEVKNFKKDIALKYNIKDSDFDPYKLLAEYNGYDARECTIVKKDGTTFISHSTLTPLISESGKNIGFIRIIKNITNQKNIEADLLRKNQVLNSAEKITMMGNWQWNLITNDVTWSSNLYNIFEVNPKKKLTYDTYFSFVHPDDRELVNISVAKSLNDKFFYDLLHRIKTTSGKTKTIQLLGVLVTDKAGNVIEIIGTCQDVTEQRMAEIKFKGLLESAPDSMVIVNELGKIQLINKQAEKLFGYQAEELINKPVELLIPQRYNHHTKHRKTFFERPKTRKMGEGKELFGINKKGKEIPIQISLSPLKTEEGLLVSAAIRDITFQKKAENKILEANKSLELLANKLTSQNVQLADFAHITSHNLRAPVSNLNSLLDFYKSAETEEERTILFDKFEIVINHLTLTLNTLIEALKTKDGSSKHMESLSFNDVLNKTKEILSGQILKTDTKIVSDFSKKPNIKYNKVYLESIFLNLVSNAIKYKSKDRSPEIFIQSVVEDGIEKLKFKDNGLGINLERHGHKVFGLNKVFHRHPEAKGVGLFMTKVQVESLGGTISVESVVNEGSTFNINFNE